MVSDMDAYGKQVPTIISDMDIYSKQPPTINNPSDTCAELDNGPARYPVSQFRTCANVSTTGIA